MKKFDKRILFSIPNMLSLYRIVTFPIVLYFALSYKENLFVILLIVDLITDVLDGFIARRFNMQTDFGAKLDAFADIGMYILAIIGVLIFKISDFEPHLLSFSIFVAAFLSPKIVSLIRFGTFPSFHLYSSKIGGYIQGFFFFFLFAFNFSTIFYYVMIIWGIASFVEQLIIVLIIPEMKTNAKGLYWILNNK